MEHQASEPPADVFAAYQDHLRRGHDELIGGDPRAALEAYRAAAALANERPLPHVSMGRVLIILRRPAEALAAFERALERAPGDVAALAGKADALAKLNRHEEAASLRRRAARAGTEVGPDAGSAAGGPPAEPGVLPRAEVLTLAGERASHDGRIKAAVAEWLAAARQHATDGHLYAALDVCQRALLADPADVRVHIEMSRLYLAAGLLDQAVERMLRLARLLDLEPMPDLRAELATLAVEHSAVDPRLAGLAAQLGEPAPG